MNINTNDYQKAHQSVVFFDRNNCTKIEVSGSDHESFLHNILSQNMLHMQTGQWRETALLSATSHVLAYFFAVKLEGAILLLSASGIEETVIALLEKFVIAEDVQIRASSHDWNWIELWGPESETLIQKTAPQLMHYKPEGITGNRTLIILKKNENYFSGESFIDAGTRHVLRIENGLLEFGTDFGSDFMLSETRLEKKSASDVKGCYPGQEVVAKIETYKRLNRSFLRFVLDFPSAPEAQPDSQITLPEINSIVFDAESGEEIGRLTSRAYSPSLKKTVGLGWLKRGFFEKPIKVTVKSETAVTGLTALFKN